MSRPLVITIQDHEVEALLTRMNITLQPESLAAFLMGDPVQVIQKTERGIFAQEGTEAVGGKWAPLAAATEDIRASQRYGAAHPINKRTGQLEDYIVNSAGQAMPDPTGATLRYPSDMPSNGELMNKFMTAQFGGTTGMQDDGRVILNAAPARPTLGLDAEGFMEIVDSLLFFVTGHVD